MFEKREMVKEIKTIEKIKANRESKKAIKIRKTVQNRNKGEMVSIEEAREIKQNKKNKKEADREVRAEITDKGKKSMIRITLQWIRSRKENNRVKSTKYK